MLVASSGEYCLNSGSVHTSYRLPGLPSPAMKRWTPWYFPTYALTTSHASCGCFVALDIPTPSDDTCVSNLPEGPIGGGTTVNLNLSLTMFFMFATFADVETKPAIVCVGKSCAGSALFCNGTSTWYLLKRSDSHVR